MLDKLLKKKIKEVADQQSKLDLQTKVEHLTRRIMILEQSVRKLNKSLKLSDRETDIPVIVRILEAVSDGEVHSAVTIAALIGANHGTVSTYLAQLHSTGTIRRVAKGQYQITKRGLQNVGKSNR